MRRRLLAGLIAGALLVGALVLSSPAPTVPTRAEQLALRIDTILDRMEPPEFQPEMLDPFWAYEIAPYFDYEGLTRKAYTPPEVVFEPQQSGIEHNHILGYTYCEKQVFINIRVINPESAWYGWARNPLATLVHEMVHTLGGDFCSWDSTIAESTTQSATLEVLAALANGGNRVALYSLLLELRETALDVVLADALEDNDLGRYREFRQRIFPEAAEEARFEKSMRFWANDRATLQDILDKYSVLVFENALAGKIVLDLPGGAFKEETVALDDLTYILEELDGRR